MNHKGLKFGDKVTHVVNDARRGIVTGYTVRDKTKSIQVTWDDLTERSHFPIELVALPANSQPIGFLK